RPPTTCCSHFARWQTLGVRDRRGPSNISSRYYWLPPHEGARHLCKTQPASGITCREPDLIAIDAHRSCRLRPWRLPIGIVLRDLVHHVVHLEYEDHRLKEDPEESE